MSYDGEVVANSIRATPMQLGRALAQLEDSQEKNRP
ncbi:hypothetical protein GGD40_006078 [Paraburkholderia bryophila]|uniref:Uncharacterized protein n=1 Tax=Paraburkholderia bryophila TaxID=420952 RepID=A0A7Y9WTH3_9BURK|nr:hypothetical protein [Paraburkholderia bryophila]